MNTRTILRSLLFSAAVGCNASPATSPAPSPSTGEAAATCTSTDGTSVVNGLLANLTPSLNKAWPSVATSTGLDPLEDVLEGQKISLKCSYGGDEICGLQAAQCKEEYAQVTVSSIQGLANMQFEDLTTTSLAAGSGTQACPYNGSASGGPYGCSYSGTGAGGAFFLNGTKLTADISEIKVKIKCEIPYIKTWTETLFSGSAKCTGSDPKGTGKLQLCAGSCASGSGANLSHTALNELDLKLGNLSCDVSPSYNPVSWIGDVLVPAVKDDLVKAVTPEIQKAINDMVTGYLPYSSACGS